MFLGDQQTISCARCTHTLQGNFDDDHDEIERSLQTHHDCTSILYYDAGANTDKIYECLLQHLAKPKVTTAALKLLD